MSEPLRTWGWPADTGACQLYRLEFPAEALRRAGHDAQLCEGTRMQQHVVDDPGRRVILQRSQSPTARAALARFNKAGRGFAFDVDDWLWGVDPDNPNYTTFANPMVRDNLNWMAHNCDVFTCSTEPLAENIRNEFGRDPVVVPNAMPQDMIDPDFEERPPRILWRGSWTHRRDVELAGYALSRASKAGFEVVLAGADYRRELRVRDAVMLDDLLLADPTWRKEAFRASRMLRDGTKIRRAVWLTPRRYLQAIREVVRPTIALAPLVGTEFNASKSHIAALEAHAVGCVVLASDVPAYRDYLSAGGRLVSNHADSWHKGLSELLDMSYSEWLAMAEAGRDRAVELSVDTLADVYVDAYRQIRVPQ